MTMSKKPKRSKGSAKATAGRRDRLGKPGGMNQATSDEFEREGLGIAPKE